MSFFDILLAILIISAALLCFALIYYLGKITKSIKTIEKDLDEISQKINPLISTVTDLTAKLSETADEARGQLELSRSIISSVKDKVYRFLDLEEKVRTKIEQPVLTLANNIRAIANGVNSFLEHFKK